MKLVGSTTLWSVVLIVGTVHLCTGSEGDEFSGFLDRLAGKPRTADNNGSVVSVSEKLPVQAQALDDWLKKLYDQYVAERAGTRKVEEVKVPAPSVQPSSVVLNRETSESNANGNKKSSETTVHQLATQKNSIPEKQVDLQDLTTELDRLLKLLGEEESKQGEDSTSELADGVRSLHKIADNMEKYKAEPVPDRTVTIADGRVKDESHLRAVMADDALRVLSDAQASKQGELKKRSENRLRDGVAGDRVVELKSVEKDAKSGDVSSEPLRELSLDDLYAELKRETVMEKRLLGTKADSAAFKGEEDVKIKEKDAAEAAVVGAVDPATEAEADSLFYAEKKKELTSILSSLMHDYEQNGGKLTNFGRRKKDDPISVHADELAIETPRKALSEQKDSVATPRSVFDEAYARALKEVATANDAPQAGGKQVSPPTDELFEDKRGMLPDGMRKTVQDVFVDAYKKSLKETETSTKKIFQDAFNRAMESVASKHAVNSKHAVVEVAKADGEPEVKVAEHAKVISEAAVANVGADRKKDLVKKFLLDFANELKKESSTTAISQRKVDSGSYESELETAAADKGDPSVSRQKLEELMKGFEVAVERSTVDNGRP